MDLFELEAFLVLSEQLHFARAASRVNLSPSALSRLLSRLEDETGVILLDRDTRQVQLTRSGEEFRDFARETILRRKELSLRLTQTDNCLRGTLRVYASVTACYSILPPFVEALSREHPELSLSVETGDPAGAANAVREGRADIAVSSIPAEGYTDLFSFTVNKTPLVFAASQKGLYSHLSLPRDTKNSTGNNFVEEKSLIETLLSVPLLLPKAGLARARFDRWMEELQKPEHKGKKPQIAIETAGNEALLALARLGLGLALVPRLVLENSPFAEGLVLYQAGPHFGDYDIGFVMKSVDRAPRGARHLTEALFLLIKKTYPIHTI